MYYVNNLNNIFTCGTLTIKCFVHPEYNENDKVIRYHGMTHVATIENVHSANIEETLNSTISEYLKKCKFKNCERTFSWKYETF